MYEYRLHCFRPHIFSSNFDENICAAEENGNELIIYNNIVLYRRAIFTFSNFFKISTFQVSVHSNNSYIN